MTDAERCNVTVYRRDQYRRTGRTKSGFEMHYSRGRCTRRAVEGDCCTQHAKMERSGWALLRAVP